MSDTVVAEMPTTSLTGVVSTIIDGIEREREREIIARRFGLYDRRETLEQIGELLGITRERVRQLEKSILTRLKTTAADGIDDISQVEKHLIRHLHEMGGVARVHDLAHHIAPDAGERERAHVAFVAEIAPHLTVLCENDNYHHSVAISDRRDESKLREDIDTIVKTIKSHGQPIDLDELHEKLDHEHPSQVGAIASCSKHLSELGGSWGLAKWPTVNPKNIRDKIYVVLQQGGKPMHFSAIAEAIRNSDFKRRNVTTQAIHNELIKDKRFVLIGRGIYALDEWGYSRGTVADIIADVLAQAGEPLHRDEIVRRVLEHRNVKETTILLNLQSKTRFVRTAKAIYGLAEKPASKTPATAKA